MTGPPAAPTHADSQPLQSRASQGRILLHAGLAALTGGQALVFAGIMIAPLFLPGTWAILLGCLLFAAGAVLHGAPSEPLAGASHE